MALWNLIYFLKCLTNECYSLVFLKNGAYDDAQVLCSSEQSLSSYFIGNISVVWSDSMLQEKYPVAVLVTLFAWNVMIIIFV